MKIMSTYDIAVNFFKILKQYGSAENTAKNSITENVVKGKELLKDTFKKVNV